MGNGKLTTYQPKFVNLIPDTGLASIKQESPRAFRPIIFRPGDGTIKIVYRGPTNPCGEVNMRGEPVYDYSLPLRAERDSNGLYTLYAENKEVSQGLSLYSAVRKLNEFISPNGRLLKNVST